MGLIGSVLTALLALLVRRQWPGLAWLAANAAIDLGALAIAAPGDPRARLLVPHLVATVLAYAGLRAARRWHDDDDGKIWAVAGWHFGAFSTFIYLTFFDGYEYTWWNWIIAIPINLFLAEIWPIYWLVLGPLLG
jgi:hypothetical protein